MQKKGLEKNDNSRHFLSNCIIPEARTFAAYLIQPHHKREDRAGRRVLGLRGCCALSLTILSYSYRNRTALQKILGAKKSHRLLPSCSRFHKYPVWLQERKLCATNPTTSLRLLITQIVINLSRLRLVLYFAHESY